ncbi:hypothetical protein HDU98_008621 [Podochytrium sp. JEL0797]|nr:hypothetical protein HDU98_008621 [Podochytrium sp. JEL0797]
MTTPNIAIIDRNRLYTDLPYRFRYVCKFIGFDKSDVQAIHAAADFLAPKIPTMVDSIYDRLMSFDETNEVVSKVLPGEEAEDWEEDEATVDKRAVFRKDILTEYIVMLLETECDARFLTDLGRLGRDSKVADYIHCNALLGFVHGLLVEAIDSLPEFQGKDGADKRAKTLAAFSKLLWIQNDFFSMHHMRQVEFFKGNNAGLLAAFGLEKGTDLVFILACTFMALFGGLGIYEPSRQIAAKWCDGLTRQKIAQNNPSSQTMQLVSASLSVHSLSLFDPSVDYVGTPPHHSVQSRRLLIPAKSSLLAVRDILLIAFSLKQELGYLDSYKFVAHRRMGVPAGKLEPLHSSHHVESTQTETVQYKHKIGRPHTPFIDSAYAPGCFIRHSHPHETSPDATDSNFSHFENIREIRVFTLGQVMHRSPSNPECMNRLSLVVHDFGASLKYQFDLQHLQCIPINVTHVELIPHCTGGIDTRFHKSNIPPATITQINQQLKSLTLWPPEQNDADISALKMHVYRMFSGEKEVCDVEAGMMQTCEAKVKWLAQIRADFLKGGGPQSASGCGWMEPGGVSCIKCGHVQMVDVELGGDRDVEDSSVWNACFRQKV